MIGTKIYAWLYLEGLEPRWHGRIYGKLQLHTGAFALPINRHEFDRNTGSPHDDLHAKQSMLVEFLWTIIRRKGLHTGRSCHFANNVALLSRDPRGDGRD